MGFAGWLSDLTRCTFFIVSPKKPWRTPICWYSFKLLTAMYHFSPKVLSLGQRKKIISPSLVVFKYSKIFICNSPWMFDLTSPCTCCWCTKARQISWVPFFFLYLRDLKGKTHDIMKSHFDDCRLKGIFSSCWTWVASIPKGFSSCIPALKNCTDVLFLLSSCLLAK